MNKKVLVIGDGGWGTALALVLNNNGHDVTIWGPFPKYIEAIRTSGENTSFLPGISIPSEITLTSDVNSAADTDVAVLAVPTKYFRSVMDQFSGVLPSSCSAVSVAKGLDRDSHHRMSEVASDILKLNTVAALSGPSHAEEVAQNIPTAVTIASTDAQQALDLQELFSSGTFRVYTSDDIIGTELGAALKNVIAVAVGVSDGMGFGDNTRAALITRGLSEMTRLGCALGAKASTFAGLSGMGDLIVTCTSQLSRNRSVGERIGKGEPIEQLLGDMKQAVEGVWNCKSALELARKMNIDVPITEQVHAIVHEGKDPREAVQALLSREIRPE